MGVKNQFHKVAQRKHRVSQRAFCKDHSSLRLKGCPPKADGVVKLSAVFLLAFLFSSTLLKAQVDLIPKPIEMMLDTTAYFSLCPLDDKIECPDAFSSAKERLEEILRNEVLQEFDTVFRKRSVPLIRIKRIFECYPQAETYELIIDSTGVSITAFDINGVFYAINTFKQVMLLSEQKNGVIQLPNLIVFDSPKFPHRGLLLDCSRHFFSVATVKKYIDLLAFYKMNVLHWHLTEDQGWRIEIDKYPQLTEIGAWRTKKGGSRYGGFYTKEEIRDVVAYAQKRGVTIIPEIELPGHSQAAIASYPWLSCKGEQVDVANDWGVFKEIYCAGNDSVFMFLEDILTEVMELFPSKYIHIGGDEAPKYRWEHCAKCQKRITEEGLKDEHELQSYFITRIEKFLNENGRQLIGWDEILEGGLSPNATVQSWRGMEHGKHAAEMKHNVVMSPTSHCYLDYGLDAINLKKVYRFNPIPEGLEKEFEQYILGAEVNMWTEHVPNDSVLDSRVFPRLIAMAEVLWSGPGGNFEDFYQRLQSHYSILEKMGVNYGLEVEPISVNTFVSKEQTYVEIIPGLPDLTLEYSFGNKLALPYKQPFLLNMSAPLQVLAHKKTKTYGDIYETELVHHKALGIEPDFQSVYSRYYRGGGDLGLTDGLIGSINFRDGRWRGYSGDDIDVIIDLKEPKLVREVSTHFYYYLNAWITLPQRVSVEVSNDGVAWTYCGGIEYQIDSNNTVQRIADLTIPLVHSEPIRYIRFKANNIEKMPSWHDAAGSDAWIFIDEIIVR